METEALRDAIVLDPLLLFKDLDITGDSLGQPDIPVLRKHPLMCRGNVVDFTVMQTTPDEAPGAQGPLLGAFEGGRWRRFHFAWGISLLSFSFSSRLVLRW